MLGVFGCLSTFIIDQSIGIVTSGKTTDLTTKITTAINNNRDNKIKISRLLDDVSFNK